MSDHRTLDEIKSEHGEMLEKIRKKAKKHRFRRLSAAKAMRAAALDKALTSMGVHLATSMKWAVDQDAAARLIDDQMRSNGVTVENQTRENRPDMPPHDQGLYIYKNEELVYFISMIYNNRSEDSFDIVTNTDI